MSRLQGPREYQVYLVEIFWAYYSFLFDYVVMCLCCLFPRYISQNYFYRVRPVTSQLTFRAGVHLLLSGIALNVIIRLLLTALQDLWIRFFGRLLRVWDFPGNILTTATNLCKYPAWVHRPGIWVKWDRSQSSQWSDKTRYYPLVALCKGTIL